MDAQLALSVEGIGEELAVGTRHVSKDDIYAHVYLLHRKYNSTLHEGPDKAFFARKSDKQKMLLRCGQRTSDCPFRIKARCSLKPEYEDAPWIITVSDLKHSCSSADISIPEESRSHQHHHHQQRQLLKQHTQHHRRVNTGDEGSGLEGPPPPMPLPGQMGGPETLSAASTMLPAAAMAGSRTRSRAEHEEDMQGMDDPNDPNRKRRNVGTRMKSAYLNNVIVKHVMSWLNATDDPLVATVDEVKKKVATLEEIGCPNMTDSTARRVLEEALLQMGVTNHDDFSSVPPFAGRVNALDPDANAVIQGLVPDTNLVRSILLSKFFEFPETDAPIITLASREFSSSEAARVARQVTQDENSVMDIVRPGGLEGMDISPDAMPQAVDPRGRPSLRTVARRPGPTELGEKRSVTQVASTSLQDLKRRATATEDQTIYYRSYVAPGSSVRGARHLAQHVISLHAEPCLGKYRGCLMSAMTVAPDNGAIALAYGHASAENEQNWVFFLRNLRNDYPSFCQAADCVVISNWDNGIQGAVAAVLPNAHHAVCLASMVERLLTPADELPTNMQQLAEGPSKPISTSTKSALRAYFLPCALAPSLAEHQSLLRHMESNSPATALACKRYPAKAWATAHIVNEAGRSNYGLTTLIQKRTTARQNGVMQGAAVLFPGGLAPTSSATTVGSELTVAISATLTGANAYGSLVPDMDMSTATVGLAYDLIDWHEISSKTLRLPIPKMLEEIFEHIEQGWAGRIREFESFRGGEEVSNRLAPDAFPGVVLNRVMAVMELCAPQSFQVLSKYQSDENGLEGISWLVGAVENPSLTSVVKELTGRPGMRCTCGRAQATGLPCVHALAVAQYEARPSRTMISSALSNVTMKLAVDEATRINLPPLGSVRTLTPDRSILPPLALDHPDIVLVNGLGRKKKRMHTLSVPPGFMEHVRGTEVEAIVGELTNPPATSSRDHCSRCQIRGHHVSTCSTWGIVPGLLFDNMNNRYGGPATSTVVFSRSHRPRRETRPVHHHQFQELRQQRQNDDSDPADAEAKV